MESPVIPGWSEGTHPASGDSGFAPSSRPGMTARRSLRRRHHNLHNMRRLELEADAGPHRRIFGVYPFVPGAVHLALSLHIADIDDGREDPALVRAAQREALVDARERLHGLLIHRGRHGIGRDRHGEHEAVVNDGAAAGCRQARKAADHGLLADDPDSRTCKSYASTLSLARG